MNTKKPISTPLISIITVVLNGARYIEDTIGSVLGQDYSNFEYIIVDGGSIDGTLEIISKYQDQIDIVVSEPDAGIYDAMNKGIRLSSGNIIGLLNSDDWYESDALQIVVDEIESNDILLGGAYRWKNNIKEVWTGERLSKLKWGMEFPHTAMFVTRSFYDSCGLYPSKYRIAGDYYFLLKAYLNEAEIKLVDIILSNYRYIGISSRAETKFDTYRETLDVQNALSVNNKLVNNGIFFLKCIFFSFKRVMRIS